MSVAPKHTVNVEPHPIWEMVIFVLSIYVLIDMLIETALRLDAAQLTILKILDNSICFVFIGDFCYNIYSAKNKLAYLKWGWIDLISSIPNIQILRVGRFVRLLRILRAIRSARRLMLHVYQHKSSSTLITVSLMAFTLLTFASVAILNTEEHVPGANIKTASDAIWWSLTTMATVGYGDRYPVTTEGRIIAGILIVAGIGLVGTFTAYVASSFVVPEEQKLESIDTSILEEIRQIKETLRRLEERQA